MKRFVVSLTFRSVCFRIVSVNFIQKTGEKPAFYLYLINIMKQRIEWLAKIVVYLTFFVPLVVIPTSFIFPFIVPKILLFRSLTTILIGAYALLLFINWEEYKPKLTSLNLVLGAFFVSFALSTFFGVDPYHSFWDNHERMLGLFTIFHYLAFYLICSSIFKTWTDWKVALKVFLTAGSLVMFVGLLQVGNPNLLLNGGSDRVASTLGNSIYVGGYGLFLTFAALLLLMKEKNVFWKWLEAGLGILGILGIFFSGSRGAILGLLAGLGIMVLGYALALKEHPQIRKILWVVVALGVLVLAVLYVNRESAFVQNIPAIGRTINTSLTDVKNSARWIAWQIAVESWQERPLLGWGPNNFFYAFNQHYNPRSLEFGYGETWFDNAHNILLNTLAVQGALGILVYLSIFIFGVISLIWAGRQKRIEAHLLIIGLAFLLGHLVQNVTVFENPTSYLYFMFWLAMINRQTWSAPQKIATKDQASPYRGQPALQNHDERVGTGLITTVGVLVLLVIFIFDIQPARANMRTLAALRDLGQNPTRGAVSMKTALAFNSPHIDDIRSDIGRATAQILSSYLQQIGRDKTNEILEIVYPELEKNLTLHPRDIRNQLTLTQLAQFRFISNNQPQYLFEAERLMEDALKYSPNRQQLMYNLSGLKLQLGKTDEAAKLMERTIALNPKIAESYWRLAYQYKLLKQSDKAKEIIKLAETNGIVFNDNEKNIVNEILGASSAITTTVKTKK